MPGNMGIIFTGDTQYSSCESGALVGSSPEVMLAPGQRCGRQEKALNNPLRMTVPRKVKRPAFV